MKSIFKIDFNTDTKIVVAVLKPFSRSSNIKYGSQSTVALLNTTVLTVLTTVAVEVAVVDPKPWDPS